MLETNSLCELYLCIRRLGLGCSVTAEHIDRRYVLSKTETLSALAYFWISEVVPYIANI